MKLASQSLILATVLFTVPVVGTAQTPETAKPPAEASTTVPADQQPTQEQLSKLFEVMRVREQTASMLKMLPAMMHQQIQAQEKDMASKLPPGEQMTPEKQAEMNKLTQRYMEKALNIFTPDELIADISPVYQRHLSRTDVDALITFYSSTAGQHFLTQQPEIMREYMATIMTDMKGRMSKLNDELIEDLGTVVKGNPTPAK